MISEVIVLCGGRSAEHEISLVSAASVINRLDRRRRTLSVLGIRRDGSTMAPGELKAALDLSEPDLFDFPETEHWVRFLAELSTDPGRRASTVVFPVLHGPNGEDGSVQGVMEALDLAYVGASVGGSAVGMNKIYCKRILESAGLPVLPWTEISLLQWQESGERLVAELIRGLHYPLFVKPANMGSSVGVSRCTSELELRSAIELALAYDDWVLLEQGISARELEVSVLGSLEAEASVPGEIVPSDVFYSYEAKYLDDRSRLIIPAQVDGPLAARVRDLAIQTFQLLQLEGMARVDFLLDRGSGEVWVNEPNTIPGFTRISMYPKLWEASGLPYTELLERLLQLAAERRRRRSRLRLERT